MQNKTCVSAKIHYSKDMKANIQITTTKAFGFLAQGTILNATIEKDAQGRELVRIDSKDIPWGTINPSPLQVDAGIIRHNRFAFVA